MKPLIYTKNTETKMKKYILAIAALASIASGYADTWTLDRCIEYATQNNLTVKSREISRHSAELAITEAKDRFLPTLGAYGSQSWNIGRGLTAENTYANRNTSSFGWGASLSLPLFQGMARVRQLEYAKANLAAITEQCEAAKDDITINVITSYLQALYSREMVEVATRQVDLSAHELTRRQALLDAGKIPEADMLEAKSLLASDELSLTQAENDYVLSRIDLAQLLQLQVEAEDFEIADLSEEDSAIIPADIVYARALERNHTILAARKNIDTSERNIAVAKAGYLPTLSFNAGIGSSYYTVGGVKSEAFAQQMRHNFSTSFGLSLNVPIFDGFSTRNSIRRAKVARTEAMLQLDQAEQQLFRSIQQAYYQANGAESKLASSRIAEQASEAAFAAISEKYNLGRANATEYEQAKTKALRATADRIQAEYELLLRSRLLQFYAK